MTRICEEKDCINIHHAKGLCNFHYQNKNKDKYRKICAKYRRTHPERLKESKRKSYKKHKESRNKTDKLHLLTNKIQAFKIIGNSCICCNTSEYWNLTIDHIEPLLQLMNDRILKGKAIYKSIIANPEESKKIYQTLCFGCNTSKNKYKECTLDHSYGKVI